MEIKLSSTEKKEFLQKHLSTHSSTIIHSLPVDLQFFGDGNSEMYVLMVTFQFGEKCWFNFRQPWTISLSAYRNWEKKLIGERNPIDPSLNYWRDWFDGSTGTSADMLEFHPREKSSPNCNSIATADDRGTFNQAHVRNVTNNKFPT